MAQVNRLGRRRTLGSPQPLALPVALPVDPAATKPMRAVAVLPVAPSPPEVSAEVAARIARAKRHAAWLETLEGEWREALDRFQYRPVRLRYLRPLTDGGWQASEVAGVLTGFGIDDVGRRTACIMTSLRARRHGDHGDHGDQRGDQPTRIAVPLMWITQVEPA